MYVKLFLVIWLVGWSVSQAVPSEGSPFIGSLRLLIWRYLLKYVKYLVKIRDVNLNTKRDDKD